MWNDILVIEKITMTQRVNILLYYLKMLPWIGKKIPEHWYASIKLKHVLTIIAFIFHLLSNFFMKGLYIAFMVMLPAQFMSENHGGTLFCVVFIYLIISGFAGPLLYDQITRPSKKDYVMIQLMHMNAKQYVRANWIVNAVIQAIMLWIALFILLLTGNQPIWYSFLMVGLSFAMRLAGNVFHLYSAQKQGKPYGMLYSIILFIIMYSVAYGGAYLIRNNEFAFPFAIGISVIVIGICLIMKGYETQIQYDTTMRVLINGNRNIIDGTFQKETYKKDVEIRDSDISSQELTNGQFHDKKGYAYLNALFFQRHKRLFYKPMRNRIIGILLVFLLLDIFLFFFNRELDKIATPLSLLPPMVFVLYSISVGERVTRAMFYNCDVSLLHYSYYRQPSAILENFKIRLRRIIFLNSIVATLINIGFISVLICLRTAFPILDILLYILTIYSISIFFSVHHLCMYYLLQPYTGELEMKSPIFAVVGGIVYFVSYMAMQIEGSMVFTLIVLSATILYSVIALVLVWKKASSTFHIR